MRLGAPSSFLQRRSSIIMHEMQKPKGEDIRLDESNRFLRWLDNYWYHYKWHTLIVCFFVFLLIVMLAQCHMNRKNDTIVAYCGTFGFLAAETESVRDVFNRVMPDDFDGNGEKYTEFVRYQVFSEEELIADKDANDGKGTVNLAYNTDQLRQFNEFMRTGECSVYLVSPYIYEYISSRGYLMKLSDVFDGALPTAAYDDYAVRLGDTAIYAEEAALQLLPPDTLICLTVPYAIGSSSDPVSYANSKAMFVAIVGD